MEIKNTYSIFENANGRHVLTVNSFRSWVRLGDFDTAEAAVAEVRRHFSTGHVWARVDIVPATSEAAADYLSRGFRLVAAGSTVYVMGNSDLCEVI